MGCQFEQAVGSRKRAGRHIFQKTFRGREGCEVDGESQLQLGSLIWPLCSWKFAGCYYTVRARDYSSLPMSYCNVRLLEALHFALLAHGAHFYLITCRTNYEDLFKPIWYACIILLWAAAEHPGQVIAGMYYWQYISSGERLTD